MAQVEANVLLVEDDPAARVLISARLAEAGLAVETVGTTYDAVEVLGQRADAFDVVVIDLVLPDTEGATTLSSVLEACALPVVVHSGSVDPSTGPDLILRGAARFVAKDDPDPQALVRSVLSASALSPRVPPVLPSGVTTDPGRAELSELAGRALDLLMEAVPMGAWMFTRISGTEWTVLQVRGDGYTQLRPGVSFAWPDTVCSRMVAGAGPQVVPRIAEEPAFRQAPILDALPVGRYVGTPLAVDGVGLVGTLCGIDPAPADDDMDLAQTLVPAVGQMLSSAIALDIERDRLRRRLGLADVATRTDALTGMPNRRAFDLRFILHHGESDWAASIAVIDLNGLKTVNDREGHSAGDRLITTAAQALQSALRPDETAFRIGGDEFAVLATDVTDEQLPAFLDRLRQALRQAGVSAAVGGATRRPGQPLQDVLAAADSLMYAVKGGGTTPR